MYFNNFKESNFYNHYGLFDSIEHYLVRTSPTKKGYSYIHNEDAGAIYAATKYFDIKDCYFYNNSNLNGGGIYFQRNLNFLMQALEVLNCIFKKNEAGNVGGAISIGEIRIAKINIIDSFFMNGFAYFC